MADKNPESNYDNLNPEQKAAVDWYVELQYKQAEMSGNQYAIKNPQQFLEGVRIDLTTYGKEHMYQIIEDFNNPEAKARTEKQFSTPISVPFTTLPPPITLAPPPPLTTMPPPMPPVTVLPSPPMTPPPRPMTQQESEAWDKYDKIKATIANAIEGVSHLVSGGDHAHTAEGNKNVQKGTSTPPVKGGRD